MSPGFIWRCRAARFSGTRLTGGERVIIAPTMDSIEFAWDAAKYGELPEAPVMEVLIPSLRSQIFGTSGAARVGG
ncbi:MAG: hypothetical protein CM15mP84_11220 [Cellvibrionales bacterium]|nr:MAG: hypothetical protein CM15mP84_11220 [Cellvibrionales bacterium]